ncbi:MAG: protein kinase [Candidatus Hydrogenedentes bacterium]|nr:protein kinase [Candidatus Hydrogenedentota bacterium]
MESTPISPEDESADEAPNETLGADGRFQILKTLGSGAMGEVRLARDTQLRRLVAIKTVRAELADDDAFAKRIERECVLHANVGMHPNIVMIFDTFREAGRIHMVMEYVDGETLQSLLERNAREGVSLTAQRSILICSQVLDALSRIHAQGVVHRDIKPSNIMIARDESGAPIAKLADFGIARADAVEDRLTEITVAGSGAPGTPLYMAPEQIDAATFGPVTPAADIYAMGALLYQLFSGEPPFRGTLTEVLHAHLQLTPPPLRSSLLGVVPEEMDRVLRRALAKRPADRWPSAQAFRTELMRLEAELPRPGVALTDSKSATEPMPHHSSSVSTSRSQDEPTVLSGTGLKRMQQKKTRAAVIAIAATLLLGGAGAIAAWQTIRGNSSDASPPAAAATPYPQSPVSQEASLPLEPVPAPVAQVSVPETTPEVQSPVTPAVAPATEPVVVEAPLAIVDEPPLPTEPPSEYVVQAGQTLSKIASLYQLDVRDVQWWNGLKDANNLSVGQTLYLHKPEGLPPRDKFFAEIAPPAPTAPETETVATPLVPSETTPEVSAPAEEKKPEKPKKRGWWPFSRKKQGESN